MQQDWRWREKGHLLRLAFRFRSAIIGAEASASTHKTWSCTHVNGRQDKQPTVQPQHLAKHGIDVEKVSSLIGEDLSKTCFGVALPVDSYHFSFWEFDEPKYEIPVEPPKQLLSWALRGPPL